MTRRMILILVVLLIAVVHQRAFSETIEPNSIIDFQLQPPLKDYKGWAVGVNRSRTRCFAMTAFQDQTAVWLGVGSAGNDFLIAFANRAWSSVEPGKTYELEVAYNRQNWRGTFTGFAFGDVTGLVSSGLNEGFVTDFGRSAGFEIRYQGKSIGRLSLEGSMAALTAAISCARELTKPGDPFAQSGAQADPFGAQKPAAGDISLVSAPGVKLEFGPDMPKIGSEWSLGVEEGGVVEAAVTSTDRSLILRLSPSRKENELPVTCKYSIAIYSASDKPVPGTMASWSAGRQIGDTDQKGMVELKLAGGPIQTFTGPDDYFGGRAFEYNFNTGHVTATSIEASVPSSPEIKPVRFEFQNFETVLNYLCASTQTIGFDGDNALSPEAVGRGGIRLGMCRMEACGWSVVLSKTVLWADRRGALLRVETIEGKSEHKSEDGYPTEFSDKVKIGWNFKPYEYHVFCSKSLPALIWSTEQGKYSADYLDFKTASGVRVSSAMRYSEDCHRAALHKDLAPEAFAEQFGYRAVEEETEAEFVNLYDIFSLVK